MEQPKDINRTKMFSLKYFHLKYNIKVLTLSDSSIPDFISDHGSYVKGLKNAR